MSYSPTGMGELPGEMGVNVAKLPEDKYPKPSITPPAEHPRLMFRAQDIDTIKKNMEDEELTAAVAEFNKLKEESFDGNLPEKETANYDGQKLGIIEAKGV